MKNNNKRTLYVNKIVDGSYFKLDDLIESLNNIKNELHSNYDVLNIDVNISAESDDYYHGIQIHGLEITARRLETDEEYEARLLEEKQVRQKAAMLKKQRKQEIEQAELETLRKLQDKYKDKLGK